MRPHEPGLWAIDIWQRALEKYGRVTRLTVSIYDAEGRLVCGPVHRTPLFDLFAESEQQHLDLLMECVQRCLERRQPEKGIAVVHRFGLAVVGSRLALHGETVGVAVAAYQLSEFPQAISIERLARE